MQQDSGETEAPNDQQEEQSAPLGCPRCNSTDTKFRYYNNNDRGQPRHYCKACRRYWTVGGSMRNIPFGGSRRNGKPAKDQSSLYSRISVSPNSSSDEWEHKLQHPAPLTAAVGSQILGTTKIEPLGSLSAPIPPADEISCLAAIQSLTQPHQHVANDMAILREGDFRSMALNQPLTLHLPSYIGNPGHPNWRMIDPLPQDFNNSFSFSAANARIWNSSNGNTIDPETARTSMNSNGWPHLPNYRGPP